MLNKGRREETESTKDSRGRDEQKVSEVASSFHAAGEIPKSGTKENAKPGDSQAFWIQWGLKSPGSCWTENLSSQRSWFTAAWLDSPASSWTKWHQRWSCSDSWDYRTCSRLFSRDGPHTQLSCGALTQRILWSLKSWGHLCVCSVHSIMFQSIRIPSYNTKQVTKLEAHFWCLHVFSSYSKLASGRYVPSHPSAGGEEVEYYQSEAQGLLECHKCRYLCTGRGEPWWSQFDHFSLQVVLENGGVEILTWCPGFRSAAQVPAWQQWSPGFNPWYEKKITKILRWRTKIKQTYFVQFLTFSFHICIKASETKGRPAKCY